MSTETTIGIDDDEVWERIGRNTLADIDRKLGKLRDALAASHDSSRPIKERIAALKAVNLEVLGIEP